MTDGDWRVLALEALEVSTSADERYLEFISCTYDLIYYPRVWTLMWPERLGANQYEVHSIYLYVHLTYVYQLFRPLSMSEI